MSWMWRLNATDSSFARGSLKLSISNSMITLTSRRPQSKKSLPHHSKAREPLARVQEVTLKIRL